MSKPTQTKETASASQKIARLPHQFPTGTKVRDIYTGRINTVKRSYWQTYAGGDTSDYTVEFNEGTEWNKSTNLQEITTATAAREEARQ